MSSLDSNTLVPEDELQAALAEIEKMSAEEAAAIPSLDDGGESAEEVVAEGSSGEEESSAAGESLKRAELEEASQPAASLGTDQLQTAMAEVETITPSRGVRTPRRKPVEEDEPADSGAGGLSEPATAEASPEAEPDQQPPRGPDSGEPAESDSKRMRFKIGKGAGDEAAAAPAALTASRAMRPVAPLAKRVYRMLDGGLDAVNRPFARLGTDVRAMVGWAALVTLFVSMLAIVCLPKVLPHRDAITFLQEKRAEVSAPPAAEEEDSAS